MRLFPSFGLALFFFFVVAFDSFSGVFSFPLKYQNGWNAGDYQETSITEAKCLPLSPQEINDQFDLKPKRLVSFYELLMLETNPFRFENEVYDPNFAKDWLFSIPNALSEIFFTVDTGHRRRTPILWEFRSHVLKYIMLHSDWATTTTYENYRQSAISGNNGTLQFSMKGGETCTTTVKDEVRTNLKVIFEDNALSFNDRLLKIINTYGTHYFENYQTGVMSTNINFQFSNEREKSIVGGKIVMLSHLFPMILQDSTEHDKLKSYQSQFAFLVGQKVMKIVAQAWKQRSCLFYECPFGSNCNLDGTCDNSKWKFAIDVTANQMKNNTLQRLADPTAYTTPISLYNIDIAIAAFKMYFNWINEYLESSSVSIEKLLKAIDFETWAKGSFSNKDHLSSPDWLSPDVIAHGIGGNGDKNDEGQTVENKKVYVPRYSTIKWYRDCEIKWTSLIKSMTTEYNFIGKDIGFDRLQRQSKHALILEFLLTQFRMSFNEISLLDFKEARIRHYIILSFLTFQDYEKGKLSFSKALDTIEFFKVQDRENVNGTLKWLDSDWDLAIRGDFEFPPDDTIKINKSVYRLLGSLVYLDKKMINNLNLGKSLFQFFLEKVTLMVRNIDFNRLSTLAKDNDFVHYLDITKRICDDSSSQLDLCWIPTVVDTVQVLLDSRNSQKIDQYDLTGTPNLYRLSYLKDLKYDLNFAKTTDAFHSFSSYFEKINNFEFNVRRFDTIAIFSLLDKNFEQIEKYSQDVTKIFAQTIGIMIGNSKSQLVVDMTNLFHKFFKSLTLNTNDPLSILKGIYDIFRSLQIDKILKEAVQDLKLAQNDLSTVYGEEFAEVRKSIELLIFSPLSRNQVEKYAMNFYKAYGSYQNLFFSKKTIISLEKRFLELSKIMCDKIKSTVSLTGDIGFCGAQIEGSLSLLFYNYKEIVDRLELLIEKLTMLGNAKYAGASAVEIRHEVATDVSPPGVTYLIIKTHLQRVCVDACQNIEYESGGHAIGECEAVLAGKGCDGLQINKIANYVPAVKGHEYYKTVCIPTEPTHPNDQSYIDLAQLGKNTVYFQFNSSWTVSDDYLPFQDQGYTYFVKEFLLYLPTVHQEVSVVVRTAGQSNITTSKGTKSYNIAETHFKSKYSQRGHCDSGIDPLINPFTREKNLCVSIPGHPDTHGNIWPTTRSNWKILPNDFERHGTYDHQNPKCLFAKIKIQEISLKD